MGRKRKIAEEKEIREFMTAAMRGEFKEAKISERMKAAEILLKRIDVDAGVAADEDENYGTMYGVVLIPPVTE